MKSEINIMELVGIIAKRWWLVAILVIVFGVSAFCISEFVMIPVYTSRGMIYVNNTDASNLIIAQNGIVSYSDLVASETLAKRYIELLKSDNFMSDISRKTGLYLPSAQMRSLISISSRNETEILEIKAVYPDPVVAANIVQNVLEHSKNWLEDIFKGGSVEIIDNAQMPLEPSGPNVKKNVAIGVVLGIMFGCMLASLLEILDNSVKDQAELTERYSYPVLGMIPTINPSKPSPGYSVSVDGANS